MKSLYMQAKPLARPGPRPPISNTVFHSFGGTSLPEGALDREPRGQRSKPSHCWPQAALPRPSEARAQQVAGDDGVVGSAPLGPRSTGQPTKGLPQWLGTQWISQQRDWENATKSSCSMSWNTSCTTKGTPSTQKPPAQRPRLLVQGPFPSSPACPGPVTWNYPNPFPVGSPIQDPILMAAITDVPSEFPFAKNIIKQQKCWWPGECQVGRRNENLERLIISISASKESPQHTHTCAHTHFKTFFKRKLKKKKKNTQNTEHKISLMGFLINYPSPKHPNPFSAFLIIPT